MTILIVTLVSILSGAIQNIAGFGAGIIMMLVFPHFYGLIGATSLSQAISTGMTIIMGWRYRAWLKPQWVLLPITCYMVTSLSVISIVGNIKLDLLSIAFGLFLIVLSVYFIFFQKSLKLRPTSCVAIVCGLVAGALSGLFSIGAPTMALYFLAVTDSRESYLGNLQALLAVTNIASLSMRVSRGLYTTDMLIPTAVGFASLLIGQWLGSKVAGRLTGEWFNRVVYALVGFSGVVTLVKQLL